MNHDEIKNSDKHKKAMRLASNKFETEFAPHVFATLGGVSLIIIIETIFNVPAKDLQQVGLDFGFSTSLFLACVALPVNVFCYTCYKHFFMIIEVLKQHKIYENITSLLTIFCFLLTYMSLIFLVLAANPRIALTMCIVGVVLTLLKKCLEKYLIKYLDYVVEIIDQIYEKLGASRAQLEAMPKPIGSSAELIQLDRKLSFLDKQKGFYEKVAALGDSPLKEDADKILMEVDDFLADFERVDGMPELGAGR